MYCTTCESEVPDGAKYCPGCASPIATVESQAEAEAIVDETAEAIEELVEDVADEPTVAEVELEIVQTREAGETERAQIAADAAVDMASIEASVAVPVAEAEAEGEAAIAEAVIASEVAPEPAIESDVGEGDLAEELSDLEPEAELEDELEVDDAPTVLHPWFRNWFGK